HALLPRLCIKNTNRPITIALSANQRRSTGFRGNHRMNKNNQLTAADIASLARRHSWAATGVSDYPPRDPLVGQSRFFKRYRTFIHTVDQDADNFAHVFAVEDRKSTRLNSSHVKISYAVFCLKKKKTDYHDDRDNTLYR